MTKVALIMARPNSSRLPDKHNRKIGNLTVMDWNIKRLYNIVDKIVICTTLSGISHYERYKSDKVYVIGPDIPDDNVLGRIKATAEIVKGDYYLIISGDCPLISSFIMTDLLNSLMSHQCDASMLIDGTSHVGADAISCNGIKKLEYGEHLSLNLVPNLNIFKLMPLPGIYANFRGTVDNFADLAFLRRCHQILGDNFSFEGVSNYINSNPSVNKINEHVSQKTIDFSCDKPNIGFLTEGNSEIGIGHVARCIGIAQQSNECLHKHIHFFVNNDKLVTNMLENHGYEFGKDYSFGLPVITEKDFDKWNFITDKYCKTTLDYDELYRKNPSFGVNYRLNYIPNPIKSECLITLGCGKFNRYGIKILKELNNEAKLIANVDDMGSHLKGANRIVTVWSQTAREAIFLGKIPEVYSTNLKDDDLCEYLDKKGVVKWLGNIYMKMGI